MIAALLVSILAGSVPAVPAVSQDPPIRIWLNSDRQYERGDRAKVQVETDNDGYLVVLHANADGRIRVLFPLDPTDDNFVRGGRRYEIKGRGGREAFMVDVNSGQGTVYAAVSRDPFRFDQFMRNDHWDATALSPNQLASDPEPELNDLTQRMATGRFDYDLLRYDVSYDRSVSYYTPAPVRRAYYRDPFCDRYVFRHDCDPYYYGGGSGVSVNLVFGHSYRSYYDPFYDPFYSNRYSYDPYYYGYDPYYYRPYYGTQTYYSPRPYYYNPRPVYTGRLYTPYQFKAVNRTFGGAGSIEAARDRGGEDRRVKGTDPRSFATPRKAAGGTLVQPNVTNQPGVSPGWDRNDGGQPGRRRVDDARPATPPPSTSITPAPSPDAATPRPEGRRSEVRDEFRARREERAQRQEQPDQEQMRPEKMRPREERPQPSIERAPREQVREQPREQVREQPRYEPRLEPRQAPPPKEGGTYTKPSDGGGRRR